MKVFNREDHELYSTWKSMLSRCNNPNVSSYKYYGGKGVTVCERWSYPGDGFLNFIEDMGERPKGTTLDRIDVNGNYCKDNCRWASSEIQSTNRTDNVYIEYKGMLFTESQFAKEFGLKRTTVQTRRNKGYSAEEILNGRNRRKYFVCGKFYNQKELAEYLGISPQLLNIRLVKNRKSLREVLDEFGKI